MRISKTVIFSSVIAVMALVVGAAALFPTNTIDVATPQGQTAPVVTATLEPVVVVATR